MLGMFRFGKTGLVAGSWAAALQSTFYGPNTTGLFSILQHVAMSAKCLYIACCCLC
ncbi:uncharacterized protein C8R40DRAFT_1121302 [Lentinula edodes]|uniref:uncharacterized protein n=1 Tax=Lentinula edodes TaxID=5353 RepID=UPI001E8D626A|nr:uncharacterized protein C8R40DRAFT_1121302 [Lentinula edodes]KAH7871622.1 hypothetical protein C8R40DRAFT_1121302 [Lentinula edodes]